MKKMKWVTSSAGVRMPLIIYGTAWKKERTADLVVKAVTVGFRPQILFRCLTQSGIVPLTGPCSEEHMRQDLAIFDFEPSCEDMAEVAALVG